MNDECFSIHGDYEHLFLCGHFYPIDSGCLELFIGHLSILMWMKNTVQHYNQNTFSGSEFSNFALFDQKKRFDKLLKWQNKPQQDSNS